MWDSLYIKSPEVVKLEIDKEEDEVPFYLPFVDQVRVSEILSQALNFLFYPQLN